MIKIEHVVTASPEQMEFIVEGMRNPMNSWDKSDSEIIHDYSYEVDEIKLGSNDLALMKNLAKAGSSHRKFMRMMPVYIRVTAPMYWWKEADTYKIGTVRNSTSTMHKIHEKAFVIEDFSCENLTNAGKFIINKVINDLNLSRIGFLETKDKKYWWQMIQLLPSSYNQTANLMLNYEVLAHIYHERKNHRLDEWVAFCKWIETLPYSELIIGEE